jgi:hypothetical protein
LKLHWSHAAGALAFLAIPAYFLTSSDKRPPNPPAPAQASEIHAVAAAPHNPCHQMYRTICQKRGETRDPTGAVRPDVDGELQALRTYEKIIHEHPDWSSEQVDGELVSTIYTTKRRDRLQSAYRWVQHTLELFVNRQPENVFTSSEKKLLISRLRKTELQLPPPVSAYADEPDLFTKNDVFYERTLEGKMRMRVGGAYLLTAKSWFNLVFTLGHELGHAIDPCELRASRISMPAYDHISACFMAHGLIAARDTRRECGENDQLSETFADWLAVQVVSEALKNFATEFHGPQLVSAAMNSVRDLCEQDEDDSSETELDLEFHPSPEIRIDHIFARNPAIRETLGCESLTAANDPFPEYCSFSFAPRPVASRLLSPMPPNRSVSGSTTSQRLKALSHPVTPAAPAPQGKDP